MRPFLSLLLVTLFLLLPFQPCIAQIPVTDVAHIAINYAGWIAQATNWVSQLAKMVQQYQQLVQTYDHLKHVAEQLTHPSVYTVLSLFAVVPSETLTKIDTIQDFRKLVEGSQTSSSGLGQAYHHLYGDPLALSRLAPTGPKNWDEAAAVMAQHTQSAASAILEALAVVSKTLSSLEAIHSAHTYEDISAKLKTSDITPHQTAQLGSLSSLYTAQSVDKLTQVIAAQTVMEAQKQAQAEYWRKLADNNAAMNRTHLLDAGNQTKDFLSTWQRWQQH